MYESWPKRTIKKYVQEQSTITMLTHFSRELSQRHNKKYVQEPSTITRFKNVPVRLSRFKSEYDYNVQEPAVAKKKSRLGHWSMWRSCHKAKSTAQKVFGAPAPRKNINWLHSTKSSRCPSTKEEYKLVPANWWGRIYTNCKNGKSTTASACVSAQHHFQITAGNLPFAVC